MRHMKHEKKRDDCMSCSRSLISRVWPRLLLILSLTILLTGCGASYNPPPIHLDTVTAERPDPRPPLPDPNPIEVTNVDWTVIETPEGPMLVLDQRQFENLSNNLAEILRWVREAAWRLHYYGTAPTE